MAKINLTNIGTLTPPASAVAALNDNVTEIARAMDTMLSRDGQGPNQMEAQLDMNSNLIMNLADPVTNHDAVNLESMQSAIAGAVFGDVTLEVFGDATLRTDLANGAVGASLVQFLQAGTGAVARSLSLKGQDTLSAEDFGAVGDGVTDDTAAINAAITAASLTGGREVLLQGKSYAVNAGLLLKDVLLRGEGIGNTELVQIGSPDYVVKSTGTLDSSIALTVNVAPGDTTLTMASTATLAAGDYLILSNAVGYNPLDATYKSGEMVQVLSVDSGTVVSLYSAVLGSMETAGLYNVADTTIVRKIFMQDSPGLADLTITGDDTTTSGLVSLKYCLNPRVVNVALKSGGHYGLRLDTAKDAGVSGLVVTDLKDDLGTGHVGYGVVLAGANNGVVIRDSHFTRCRHGVTTIGGPDGLTRKVVVQACLADATTAAGFDTHAAGDRIVFNTCISTGSLGQGFSIRSINTDIVNCVVSRSTNHGIAATETLVRNLAVRNCVVEYTNQHGFSSTAAAAGLILSGNTFRAIGNDGIRLSSLCTAVQILDNYVVHPGKNLTDRSAIISVADGVNSGKWLVARNYIRADDGSVGYGIILNDVTDSYVVDNKLWGTFTTAPMLLGTSNVDLRNDVVDSLMITPTILGASTNNYSATGSGSTSRMRISSSLAVDLTGLTGGAPGREMVLFNIGSFTITLSHDSASSTAANRFLCPGSTNFALTANAAVRLVYDATSSRWRVVS